MILIDLDIGQRTGTGFGVIIALMMDAARVEETMAATEPPREQGRRGPA